MRLAKNHQSYKTLIQLIENNPNAEFIEKLFDAILTDKEQLELAKRLQIFAILQQGLPQREISERLEVGVATVSRGAKAYQTHQINELLPKLDDVLSE